MLALGTCVLVVVLSAMLIIAAQANLERGQVQERMQSTSALAQAYVREQTTGLGVLVASYADRSTLRGALEARRGDKAAEATVIVNLKGLAQSRPDVSATFLTDARGVLLGVHPSKATQLGKSFAFRDWYQGAVKTGGPYVSEAYQSRAVGQPFVVATSSVVRGTPTGGKQGPVIGVVAATHALSNFQQFVDGYAATTGIRLVIIDQRGVMIADGGHPIKPGTSLEERRAAGGRAITPQGALSAKITDPGTGWTVISAVPDEVATGPATSFRRVVLLAAGFLLVLLVGGAGAADWIRHNRRVAQREVREVEERAKTESRRAAEEIDRFFSLSLDLLCIANTDGYFEKLNPAWQTVLGYDQDELLEQPFMNFVHPDDLVATAAENVALEGGALTVAFENRYRCRDGSYKWLRWNVAPLPDEGRLYAVASDITDRKHVEQASARLAAIVDSSVDAIAGADLQGTVTSWNRGAEQIFGYRPDEIIGQPMNVLAAPEDDSQKDLVARVALGEVIAPYEASRVRRDGQLIEVALTTSPVHDPDGTVIGISMIARDISETKRTEEALRAIIATASDGFVCMDPGGLITEWNHRAELLFGWARHEVIGREMAALIIPEQHRDAHRDGMRRVLGGGEAHILDRIIEVSALHRDGREIPVELSVWRASAGSVDQFSAFVRDITERQQIARDVVSARDQALEASRLKSAFLATMSHEIRTPMNGVIGLTGLLLRGDLGDTQRRYVDGIRVAGNALLDVINDILDFSKIEAGALILDDAAFDLGGLMEEVVGLVSETARSKGVELLGFCDPAVPTLLRGDPARIRQILLNLASNAVKFTDQGEVFVHIRPENVPSRRAKDPVTGANKVGVRFEVSDTGIGIDPSDHARLFDPFAQADSSTTRRFGGTGLGLAICRELVEAMGGQIGVESRPNQGSTFWCTIPFRADTHAERKPNPRDASLEGQRVLVVDDSETNRLILTQQLSAWAMFPTAVESGDEALDHLQGALTGGEHYDLAIVDMHMPGLDGLELARRIRDHVGILPLPIVLASSGEAVAAVGARDANIVAFLNKPIQQSQLYDCLVGVAAGKAMSTQRPAQSVSAPPLPPRPTMGRLLLVEDNEINQMVATGILTELGYAVDIAGDGVQALEMVARKAYRAVIMDCQMPNMDGYEATGELRRRERVAEDSSRAEGATRPTRMPIIAMTAAALKEDRDRCLAAGMDDYLTKPIQPEALAAALIRWTTGGTSAQSGGLSTIDAGTSTEASILYRLEELREHANAGLVSRLVASFLIRAPGYLSALTDALERGNADAFAHAAHSLNGAAGNLGASAMGILCDELEVLGRDEQLQSAPPPLDRLHVEYAAVRAVLEEVSAQPATSSR